MKKLLLVLFLSVGATTFASTGKVSKPLNSNKKVERTKKTVAFGKFAYVLHCSSYPDVEIRFTADSDAEAVRTAGNFCGGGTIEKRGLSFQ